MRMGGRALGQKLPTALRRTRHQDLAGKRINEVGSLAGDREPDRRHYLVRCSPCLGSKT